MTAWTSNMMMSVNSSKSWRVVEALGPNFPKTTPTTMQKNRIPETQSPIYIRHHQGDPGRVHRAHNNLQLSVDPSSQARAVCQANVKATWSVRGFIFLLQNNVIRYKLYLL